MDLLQLPGAHPGVQHFCTTRTFGNVSLAWQEFGDAVDARHRLAQQLELQLDDLVMTALVHGRTVLRAYSRDRGRGARGPGTLGEADAIFTTDRDLWLMVTSADCYPILVSGPGCLGLAHAGWRGVLSGVLPALVDRMCRDLDVEPGQLRVTIGPGIGPAHFQLGPTEIARFRNEGHASAVQRDRRVDLPAILEGQASRMAVGTVHQSGHCTFADAERFFSYRREHGRTGRFGLAARLL